MKTLTIVDTFGFFFRFFYALKNFKNSRGEPSGVVSGFANFIYSPKNEYKSDCIIFALGSKGETFRSEIDPSYKTNRTSPLPELLTQIPIYIKMIEKMGFVSTSKEYYKVDDIIVSVVRSCNDKDIFMRIITQDKDLYQLIKDGKVSIYSPISKDDYDEAACLEKYGVKPSQIKDFLTLCGDSADSIPGVKGIGAKGAKNLLDEFGNIEEIYENLSFVRNERSKNLPLEGKENVFLSKKLASLYKDLDLKDLIEKSVYTQEEPLLRVLDYLERFELNSLLKKLKADSQDRNQNLGFKAILILDENTLFDKLESFESGSIIAFDTEITGFNARETRIVGLSFCVSENEAFYVPLNHTYLAMPSQILMQAARRALG